MKRIFDYISKSFTSTADKEEEEESGDAPPVKLSRMDTFQALIRRAPKPKGASCQIIKYCPDSPYSIQVDQKGLWKILDKAGDSPIIIMSVCGRFRKGKSFLLNLLLRYFDSLESGNPEKYDDNSPLGGFSWKPGRERVTQGIHMWDHPFMIQVESGIQVAVILMDTHGLFDKHTPLSVANLLVSLSVLISSVQIYNVSENIGEDHLQSLELFSTTASMAIDVNDGIAPFQRLVFLIRDWFSPLELPFGSTGGKQYLDEMLTVSCSTQAKTRGSIREAFKTIDCFLMPYPGDKTARPQGQTEPFSGKMADLSTDFKEQLNQLQAFLFEKDKWKDQVKMVGGEVMTKTTLFQHIVGCISLFQKGKLPSPESTTQALLDQINRPILKKCVKLFRDDLQTKFQDVPAEKSKIQSIITAARARTLSQFKAQKRGTEDQVQSQIETLQSQMKDIGDVIFQTMEAKLMGKWAEEINVFVQKGKEEFSKQMSEVCLTSPYMQDGIFLERFEATKSAIIQQCEEETSHIESDVKRNRICQLRQFCDEHMRLYKTMNEMKNPERLPDYEQSQRYFNQETAKEGMGWMDMIGSVVEWIGSIFF